MKRLAKHRFLFALLALILAALTLFSYVMQTHAAGPTGSVATQPRYFTRSPHATTAKGSTIPYHGGPVMFGTVSVYNIFWEPAGSTVDPRFNGLLSQFFNDFSQSSVFTVTQQYKDSKGNLPSAVQTAASWVDTQAYPSKDLSDKQIQAEVTRAMKINGWTSSLQHVFFVFTVQGENMGNGSFCAYHNKFGSQTIYAPMPDLLCGTPTSPNNDKFADNVIDSSSHELMESMTDPLLNAWTSNSLGEIGDPCSTTWGPPNPKFNNGDITGNGHFYMVQKEWSNAVHGCAMSFP